MKIVVTRGPIKEAGEVYEQDQEYDVDRDLGVFFVRSGWATSPEYQWPPDLSQAPTEHDIQPDSVRHTVTSTEG